MLAARGRQNLWSRASQGGVEGGGGARARARMCVWGVCGERYVKGSVECGARLGARLVGEDAVVEDLQLLLKVLLVVDVVALRVDQRLQRKHSIVNIRVSACRGSIV